MEADEAVMMPVSELTMLSPPTTTLCHVHGLKYYHAFFFQEHLCSEPPDRLDNLRKAPETAWLVNGNQTRFITISF